MSSEDVLLIVKSVWHKKSNGDLYLMNARLAWMPASRDTFLISHNYADIKVQKISPDSKEKVQLQVVLYDGGANTFHFRNPGGRQACIQDRESVKDLLQRMLPKYRVKVSSELEEKHRLLQENSQLFQLYNDLVVSGVISAEEFWVNRTNLTKNTPLVQQVGVSAAFLADIRPQADGANSLRYNLSADMIESIFRTYPRVREKHAEYVPHKITESEFWTKFFQSHYYHRDRTVIGSKDLFADCAKADDKDIEDEIRKSVQEHMLDLSQVMDGVTDEDPMLDVPPTHVDSKLGAVAAANRSMIKRFNYHSTMVLKSCENRHSLYAADAPATAASDEGASNATAAGAAATGSGSVPPAPETAPEHSSSSAVAAKKPRIVERDKMEDLEGLGAAAGTSLMLSRTERYFHGPTPVMAATYMTTEDMLQASFAAADELRAWPADLTQVLEKDKAREILMELSPGGVLMQGSGHQQLASVVPDEIKAEIKHHYVALTELLKHFWSSFPVQTKMAEDKVMKAHSNLQRFHSTKLLQLKNKMSDYGYSINLTGHMEDMMNAALVKYNGWFSKRMHKAASTSMLQNLQ